MNVQLDLPPCQPILDRQYSLEPDMVFGWMPKFKFNGPVPTNFTHDLFDSLITLLSKSRNFQLVYLGFRPINSLHLHDVFVQLSQY